MYEDRNYEKENYEARPSGSAGDYRDDTMRPENREVVTSPWTPSLEKALVTWERQIGISERQHRKYARVFSQRFYRLSIAACIIGGLATFVSLITFEDCTSELNVAKNSIWCSMKPWLRLAGAGLSGLGAVFVGIQTTLDYRGKSKDHLGAANKFLGLLRVISNIRAFPPSTRGDPQDVLSSIVEYFEDIVKSEDTPLIPENSNKLKYEVKGTRYKKHNDVELQDVEEDTCSPSHQESVPVISVDPETHKSSAAYNSRFQHMMNNELCSVNCRTQTYGVVNVLSHELERLDKIAEQQ